MKKPSPHIHTSTIWVLLNSVHIHLMGQFETALRRAGLPNTRWYDVLWTLEKHAPKSGLRQFEVEHAGLLDQPNLSRTLKQMAQRGLVSTCTAEGDGRGRVLHITDKGRETRAQMWEIYGSLMIEHIENRVDPEQASALINGLRQLLPEDWSRLGIDI